MIIGLLIALAAALVAGHFALVASRARAEAGRMQRIAAMCADLSFVLVDRDERIALVVGGPLADRALAEQVPRLEPGARVEWEAEGAVYRVDALPFDAAHTLLTVRDISTGRGLQRSLEVERTFLSAVLSQLGERVRVADADGRLLTFDGADADTDLHPLEWAERFGLHHPDGRIFGPHETPLLRALRGEDVREVEVHVEGRDGHRTLLESGGPVHGPDGTRLGAVTVTADLTAYRDAEGRLRRSEERHRRVVESVSDCVFETDAQGRWTYLSGAWAEATGHSVEECLGRPCWESVHPEDRGDHARAFAPLMGGERAALRHSHRFITAAGAERWGEVQVRAISGWDGLPTGFVGVMRDVTDERRAHQHAATEQAVMRYLTSAGLDEAGTGFVEVLARELGWDGAELWRMDADERIHRFATWTAPDLNFDRFFSAGDDLSYEVGDGFPGLAWTSREPLWKVDVTGEKLFRRLEEGIADGIHSTVALPLRNNGEPVAVVVLISRSPREPETGLPRLLEAISGQVTQFIQRREADLRVAAQAEDLRTLSAVAHELAGETDAFAARGTLCRAVRDVTSAATVSLWEPSGDALAVSASIGAAVRGLSGELDVREPTAAAFLTGELQFAAVVHDGSATADIAGAASAAWVPVLRGDRECVGVLAVGWADARSALSSREEELLRLLASEAAITIHRTDLLTRLHATARTDALTGLPNRRVWDEDLDRELARAGRHGGSLCLAILDLDRFKAFNDQYGHQAGDELLAQAATAWRPELRTTDTLARYGGEEFAVLLPHSDIEGARAVVERLLAVVPLDQTASAGIALWDGAETALELVARADAALYDAKDAGRARALIAA